MECVGFLITCKALFKSVLHVFPAPCSLLNRMNLLPVLWTQRKLGVKFQVFAVLSCSNQMTSPIVTLHWKWEVQQQITVFSLTLYPTNKPTNRKSHCGFYKKIIYFYFKYNLNSDTSRYTMVAGNFFWHLYNLYTRNISSSYEFKDIFKTCGLFTNKSSLVCCCLLANCIMFDYVCMP